MTLCTYSLGNGNGEKAGSYKGKYLDKDFSNFKINDVNTTKARITGDLNAQKTGIQLLEWIDYISKVGYFTNATCISRNSVIDTGWPTVDCGHLVYCDKTIWSSEAPDHKSDVMSLAQNDNIHDIT